LVEIVNKNFSCDQTRRLSVIHSLITGLIVVFVDDRWFLGSSSCSHSDGAKKWQKSCWKIWHSSVVGYWEFICHRWQWCGHHYKK